MNEKGWIIFIGCFVLCYAVIRYIFFRRGRIGTDNPGAGTDIQRPSDYIERAEHNNRESETLAARAGEDNTKLRDSNGRAGELIQRAKEILDI